MKVSERRVSFTGIQSAALKPFTSAAMRVGNAEASNFVMGPTPVLPWTRLSQASRTVFPTGETMPSPVTTTLRGGSPLGDRIITMVSARGTVSGPAGSSGRDYCLTCALT
jgi:hypothetical protein